MQYTEVVSVKAEFAGEDGEAHEDEGFIFTVTADNGERLIPVEVYDSTYNAQRGLADLTRTLLRAVAAGEIDLSSFTEDTAPE